jgi:uncharacterized membrane protein (Fun14 family)
MYGATLATTGGAGVILGLSTGWWAVTAIAVILVGVSIIALFRKQGAAKP